MFFWYFLLTFGVSYSLFQIESSSSLVFIDEVVWFVLIQLYKYMVTLYHVFSFSGEFICLRAYWNTNEGHQKNYLYEEQHLLNWKCIIQFAMAIGFSCIFDTRKTAAEITNRIRIKILINRCLWRTRPIKCQEKWTSSKNLYLEMESDWVRPQERLKFKTVGNTYISASMER